MHLRGTVPTSSPQRPQLGISTNTSRNGRGIVPRVGPKQQPPVLLSPLLATPASSSGNGSTPPDTSKHIAAAAAAKPLIEAPPWELNLAYESERRKGGSSDGPQVDRAVKTTGLHRAPLSGGVKSATIRYDLPSPQTAVRNLLEHARFGHVCTIMSGMHHRRAGYPFGTVVDFAVDGAGHPFFCLSMLAIHARNVIEDPRISLVVQMPGWTGLANARVTIFGDVYQLPEGMQATARDIFSQKHSTERKERWLSGNFVYFRMNKIVDIYFVGGFGTVQWIDPEEYLRSTPDEIVLDNVTRTLDVLNEMYSADLKRMLAHHDPIQELMLISIDATGADVRVRSGSEFTIERLGFERRVRNLDEAIAAVKQSLKAAGVESSVAV